jgi:hypothetical protein
MAGTHGSMKPSGRRFDAAMVHGVSAPGLALRPNFNRYTEDVGLKELASSPSVPRGSSLSRTAASNAIVRRCSLWFVTALAKPNRLKNRFNFCRSNGDKSGVGALGEIRTPDPQIRSLGVAAQRLKEQCEGQFWLRGG